MRWSQGDLVTEKKKVQREKGNRCAKKVHTKKTDETLGSLQEGEGVDALISDGNVCEGLGRLDQTRRM